MRLYNLTYQNEYLASSVKPLFLPENNYILVEIIYSENIIYTIKGSYNFETEKECILTDLDISPYIKKLKEIQNKDKIYINFKENISDENERINKIFITLLSSYLVYFNFLDFPYEINLDLLTNDMFIYFTSFSPMNPLEESLMKQVSLFHRFFSNVFIKEEILKEDESVDKSIVDESVDKSILIGLDKINYEVDKLVQELKEYKRKFLKDIDIKEIKRDITDIKRQLKNI